jgi:rod shape determining protein RodA
VEVTRLALAVALAAYAEARARDMGDWRTLAAPLAMTAVHLGLILLQPDLSSALSLGPMTLAVLYVGGAPLGALAILGGTAAIALGIPLLGTYFSIIRASATEGAVLSFLRHAFASHVLFMRLWGIVALAVVALWWFLKRWRVYVSSLALLLTLAVMAAGVAGSFAVEKAIKDYQRKRLIAFVNPAIDPLGAGYNILQSKITLGSGRFLGKGYLSGSQSQLGFLPEKHTDFIFSLIGEELGFVGALTVLGLYFWIVFRAFDIGFSARDRFGRYLAVGIGTYFAFTGLVNIGMVMGLMPVTGLPFPFVSYGGSDLVGSFIAVGLLLSIHLRRYIL